MGQNQSTNGESKRGLQPKSFAGNYHNQIPLTIILNIYCNQFNSQKRNLKKETSYLMVNHKICNI